MSDTNQVLFDLAKLVGAGVVGGLIVSYATHLFTLRRERDTGRRNRKREFRSFIIQFKAEANRYYSSQRAFEEFYLTKVPLLHHAAANITGDFPRKRREEFDRLVNTASGIEDPNVPTFKKRVVESVDAILAFIDT